MEMKARFAAGTEQRAREVAKLTTRLKQRWGGDGKHFKVSADSYQDFRDIIPLQHEAMQVLHHVYTNDLEKIMLVVGDNNGDLIYAVTITFPEVLTESYGNILFALKAYTLKCAYADEK